MTKGKSASVLLLAFLLSISASISSSAQAVRNLVTQPIVETEIVPLRGQVSPRALAGRDLGPAHESMAAEHLILLLNRTTEQQQRLDALTDELHDPKSPSYHQWLTPEDFGHQFGPTDSDIDTLVGWLQAQGFTIDDIPAGRTHLIFSGTVGQVEQAFHTQIRSILVDGEQHHANLTEPSIPLALAPLVKGFRQLSDFRAKPMKQSAGVFQRDPKTGAYQKISGPDSMPEITFSGNGKTWYDVTPQDFYTIYNVNPLLQSGVNGAGVTIAVIEETNVANISDISDFRSQFGLPPYPTNPNNTQGGVNWMIGPGNGCSSVGVTNTNEEAEALLDVEWAGAVAPNAIVDFVACNTVSNGIGSYGTDLAASYIANHLASSVSATSLSYGECEYFAGSNGASFYSTLWQQMAAEGITAVVASGDSGSMTCDQTPNIATHNLSVNAMSSTAYNVSGGGTDFSDTYQTVTYSIAPNIWWNANDSAPYGSALSYVPEISWGGYCASPLFGSYLQKIGLTLFGTDFRPIALCNNQDAIPYRAVAGGGGGVSVYNSIPTWQSVYGVGVGNTSTSMRNQPDIALFASAGWWNHALLYCQSDTGTPCDYSNPNNALALGAGGTSFVAPQINGLMALIVQKTGSRQGNADYTLYGLAAQEYGTPGHPNSGNLSICSGSGRGAGVGSNCIFRDIAGDTPSLQGGVIVSDIVQACQWKNVNTCWTDNSVSHPNGLSSAGNHSSLDLAAYQTGQGYDGATGLGSVNIANLVSNWNTLLPGFPTATVLQANPTTIDPSQSTTLTATVSENGRGGIVPPSGSVSFYIGSVGGTWLGTAPLVPSTTPSNQATGAITVQGTSLAPGANSLIAYFPGDGANDGASTSPPVTVTVNSDRQNQTITFPNPGTQTYGVTPIGLNATASSGLPVTYTVTSGPATLSGNLLTITGAGWVTVQANQSGNSQYNPAPPVSVTFDVLKATLTVTAQNATSVYGQPLPGLTYAITGFVNGDTLAVVSGAASESTTATPTSPPGTYPIVITQGTLAAANYTFSFVNGALTMQQANSSTTASAQSSTMLVTQQNTLTAIVSVAGIGGAPTGSVRFTANGNVLGTASLAATDANDATAQLQITGSQLRVGSNTITAMYVGDPNYAGSTSPPITVTVIGLRWNFTSPVGMAAAPQAMTYTFSAPATLSAINITTQGLPNRDFTDAGGSTCIAGSAYNAGDTCSVNVGFTPAAPGLRAGAVTLFAQGQTTALATLYANGLGQSGAVAIDQGTQTVPYPGSAPSGMALDAAGNMYVLDNGTGSVIEVAAGSLLQSTVMTNVGGQALALDGAGNLYVGNTSNQVLMVPNENGTLNPADASVVSLSGLGNPSGLAVDGGGNLYVSDSVNGDVIELSPAGIQTTVASGIAPTGITADAAGNVYVAASSQALEYLAGGGSTMLGSGFVNAVAIAVDPSGTAYVGDAGNGQLVKVVGGASVGFPVAGLTSPQGLAIDAAGNLYVADVGGSVYEVNRSLPVALNFGNVSVGSTSAPQIVAVSNIGNQPLTVSNLVVSTGFIQLPSGGTDCNASSQLSAAASCAIAAAFSPTARGPASGTVTLTDNSLNNPASTQSVALSGTGAQQTQTITFPNPGTQTYGVAPIMLTATASSGLPVTYTVLSGPATVSGSILTISGAGEITVEADQAGNDQYAAAPPVQQSFAVNQAVLTVSAQNSSAIYGSGLPSLTYSMTGFVNGDTQSSATSGSPALSTTASSTPAVGSYPITAAQGTLVSANYTFRFAGATLTVTKASLTVTANTITTTYGHTLLTLTYTITGFQYSDTQTSATTGVPLLSVWVTPTSPPGNYPISIGMGSLAAANYTFAMRGGTLIVTKATPVLTWNPSTHTIQHGTPLGAGVLDATVAGNLAGSFVYTTVVNGTLTTVTTSTVLPPGTYTITVTFTPSNNTDYTTATAQQVITVTP